MLGLCRGRRRQERRLDELEERIEGLETLEADKRQRPRHSSGRGVLPGTARIYQDAQAKGGER